MSKKRIISKFIIFSLLIQLLLPHILTVVRASGTEAIPKTDSITKGVVTASSLVLRSEPSTSSKMLAALPRGTIVDILEKNEE